MSDGLADLKKLRAAVERVAKKLGIQLQQGFTTTVTDDQDYVNMKFVIPAALFESTKPEEAKTREKFDAMMGKESRGIDMSAFEANLGAIGDEDE